MKYLIIDKKQRVQLNSDSTYATERIKEELDKINAEYTFATTDDIEITINENLEITVLGQELTTFTHIILRGHRLHKPWEYETKQIIAHYIDQYNRTNPEHKIKLQNTESFKVIGSYDKLLISNMCNKNNLPIISTHYKSDGDYTPLLHTYEKFILKDFTGENDLRQIDGKEKIKKNVYLIEKPKDLQQENLKNKDLTKYFAQKFIPTGEDLRVFVSNGIAIGGFKRKSTQGLMTVNKGEYTSLDLNNETDIKELSEKTAKVFQANFIAIDLMRDEDGKLLILEISLNPGFKAYETKTAGNVENIAKAIIQSF